MFSCRVENRVDNMSSLINHAKPKFTFGSLIKMTKILHPTDPLIRF